MKRKQEVQSGQTLLGILVLLSCGVCETRNVQNGNCFGLFGTRALRALWILDFVDIGFSQKGALQFLGRSIYRAQDGESSLYFGVSREYMVGIFESWGENIKAGHVGLMLKLEDVHKEFVKKFGEEPLTEKGIQRYRRVLGQLAWAALSRADLSFPISFLSRFQAKAQPCCRTLYACLHEMAIRESAFCPKNASTSVSSHRRVQRNCFLL